MFRGVRCVMVFALDPEKSARWWADVFGTQVQLDTSGSWLHSPPRPLRIAGQRQICQLTEPFGTIIGLDGP
ncbi:MAG: hypothetical protein ACRDSR_22100 [Pseudonocardiaceae bacterium]